MRKILYLLMMLLVLGLVAGCTNTQTVKGGELSVEDETAKSAGEGQKSEEVEEVAGVSLPGEEISAEEIARAEAGGLDSNIVKTSDLSYKDILFDFDRYDIKDESQSILTELANWLINNKDGMVLLEGHCDERGTNQYNLALGDRRANAAKDFLIASGVPSRKIDTISYGEERPQCTDHNENCWSLNRRAHYIVSIAGR